MDLFSSGDYIQNNNQQDQSSLVVQQFQNGQLGDASVFASANDIFVDNMSQASTYKIDTIVSGAETFIMQQLLNQEQISPFESGGYIQLQAPETAIFKPCVDPDQPPVQTLLVRNAPHDLSLTDLQPSVIAHQPKPHLQTSADTPKEQDQPTFPKERAQNFLKTNSAFQKPKQVRKLPRELLQLFETLSHSSFVREPPNILNTKSSSESSKTASSYHKETLTEYAQYLLDFCSKNQLYPRLPIGSFALKFSNYYVLPEQIYNPYDEVLNAERLQGVTNLQLLNGIVDERFQKAQVSGREHYIVTLLQFDECQRVAFSLESDKMSELDKDTRKCGSDYEGMVLMYSQIPNSQLILQLVDGVSVVYPRNLYIKLLKFGLISCKIIDYAQFCFLYQLFVFRNLQTPEYLSVQNLVIYLLKKYQLLASMKEMNPIFQFYARNVTPTATTCVYLILNSQVLTDGFNLCKYLNKSGNKLKAGDKVVVSLPQFAGFREEQTQNFRQMGDDVIFVHGNNSELISESRIPLGFHAFPLLFRRQFAVNGGRVPLIQGVLLKQFCGEESGKAACACLLYVQNQQFVAVGKGPKCAELAGLQENCAVNIVGGEFNESHECFRHICILQGRRASVLPTTKEMLLIKMDKLAVLKATTFEVYGVFKGQLAMVLVNETCPKRGIYSVECAKFVEIVAGKVPIAKYQLVFGIQLLNDIKDMSNYTEASNSIDLLLSNSV